MRIRSLQNKIFVLVVSLFIAVFILNFYSIIKAAGKQAESLIEARLNVGKRIVLDEFRTEQASFDSNVATIAQDWGFRQALGQGVDSRTLVNILQNHINRISGDFAFIFDTQNNLIASTYDLPQHSLARLHQAAIDPEHEDNMPLAIIDNTPFFLSSEIVEAPIEIGRIVVGKTLHSSLFTRLEEQISLGITLISTNQSINNTSQNKSSAIQSKNTGLFSTMPALIEQTQDNALNPFLSVSFIKTSGEGYTQKLDWYGVEYITVSLPLNIVNLNSSQNSFVVVLHDSLSQAMSIFDRFWIDILPFFFGGILVSLLGALAIARGITRPVKSLLEAAKYVANGHYSAKLEVKQSGELGQLAQEFQNMQSAVMARENEIKQQALALQESEKIKFEAEIAHKERLLAEEATQAKSRFLASMSHEIRTPLTSIIGFSETLQDKSMNPEEQVQAINTINRCGTHLLNVINDILDVSKIEAGKIEVEVIPTPIFPLLHEVKQLANMQANNKGIEFELNLNFPLPLLINSDPTRLKQILFNLINNAIKFTESGKVSLTVQHGAQTLFFTLQDTGIGMTEQQLGKLFSAFTQADSSITRQHGGTGLGLYICKQLSSLLGGHIEVKSQYKLGSEFKLSLPCPQDTEAKQVTNLSEAKRLSQLSEQAQHIPSLKGKVLYADDNDDNRRLVSYLIKQTGAQVITAENGEQAVEQALANDFELVLMDMQMPVMDGIEATELLCSAGFSKPIIMMTANVDRDSIEQCAQSGAVGHFGKPVDTLKFHHLLSEYLTQSAVINHEPSLADLDNFDDMARQFLSSLPEQVKNLKTANKAQDWLTIQDIVHQIKGSAGSFGYQELSEHAATFEKTLQETKQEQNNEPFDLFLQQIQHAIEGVE